MPKRSRSDAAASDAAPTGPPLTVAIEAMARETMLQMWREGSLCDCEVTVGGRVFSAHRLVLAASSDFMKSAFTVGLAETTSARVTLEEMEASIFEAVLEAIYAGSCTFDESRSLEMLHAASRLGVKPLEDAVVIHVIKGIDALSCLAVWKTGDALSLPELVQAAQKCAEGAFDTVAASEAFLGVPGPWLEGLLSSDELVIDKEEQVFEALKRWHAAQRPPPSQEVLDKLLALVRWPLMEQRFVAEHVNSDRMVKSGALVVAKAFQDAMYGTRPRARAGRTRTICFGFQSAFDTNGVLHYIGTRGGRAVYRNPHEAGEVVASASSLIVGNITNFVQHSHEQPVYTFTDNATNSWMSVDLGEGRSLVPDHYCLRSDRNPSSKPRNWELQGSLDGTTWQTLRRHENDASLADYSMSTAAWPVDAGGQGYRHFRIFQTGQTGGGSHHLMCAGIELYGSAKFERPLA
eukprot:Transcript_3641.p1 GENE.Transcript_3641~~Transcript_3641.p1  ORF type:complete len:480 (-),score=132.37 Transcript_3641:103-1491(-)